MATNTFSGARAIFRYNNKIVAYASGVDVSKDYQHEPVDVLDRVEVAEYVPVGYRVTFNCAIFRTVANSRSTGLSAGTNPGPAHQGQLGSVKQPSVGLLVRTSGTPSEMLTNGYMSASITDRLTQQTLYRLQGVKATSNSFSVTARGIVSQNIGFVATRCLDESEAI